MPPSQCLTCFQSAIHYPSGLVGWHVTQPMEAPVLGPLPHLFLWIVCPLVAGHQYRDVMWGPVLTSHMLCKPQGVVLAEALQSGTKPMPGICVSSSCQGELPSLPGWKESSSVNLPPPGTVWSSGGLACFGDSPFRAESQQDLSVFSAQSFLHLSTQTSRGHPGHCRVLSSI